MATIKSQTPDKICEYFYPLQTKKEIRLSYSDGSYTIVNSFIHTVEGNSYDGLVCQRFFADETFALDSIYAKSDGLHLISGKESNLYLPCSHNMETFKPYPNWTGKIVGLKPFKTPFKKYDQLLCVETFYEKLHIITYLHPKWGPVAQTDSNGNLLRYLVSIE